MSILNKKEKILRNWLDKIHDDCVPYLMPVRLDICITTACNTKCPYCWQQEKPGTLLSFKIITGVIDDICALAPPIKITLTGGEPTIWPDLNRLIIYARESGIKNILLCTNGYNLRSIKFAEELINLGVTAMSISVDTFNPDKFQMLRGYRFSEFKEILSNCIYLKRKYSYFNIALASVISKAVAPEELFEIQKFCMANKFDYFLQTFDETIHDEVNKEFYLSPQEIEIYKQKLVWLKGRVADVIKRNHNPFTEGKEKLKCYKGITTVKISSDGSVRFCWKGKSIGNILQDSFIKIWTSPEARKIRECIREKKCECVFDCDIYESLELYDYL